MAIAAVMHQHNGVRRNRSQAPLDAARPSQRPPIDSAHIPHNEALAQTLRFVRHAGAAPAVRRTKQSRRDAGRIRQAGGAVAHFRTRCGGGHNPGVAVAESVIAERVTFGGDASGERRRAAHVRADHEERRAGLRLRKQIQNPRRPLQIRSVVESEIDGVHATRHMCSLDLQLTEILRKGLAGEPI